MKTPPERSEMTKGKSPNLNQGKLVASVKNMIQSGCRNLETGKPGLRSIQEYLPQTDLRGQTGSKLARLRGLSLNAWKIPSLSTHRFCPSKSAP
jgi:hypothetical protein